MPRGRRLASSSPRGGWPPWDSICRCGGHRMSLPSRVPTATPLGLRRRHQRSGPRKQLERRHQSMLRPTAMEVLDPIRDAAVTKPPEPLERERRTRPVSAIIQGRPLSIAETRQPLEGTAMHLSHDAVELVRSGRRGRVEDETSFGVAREDAVEEDDVEVHVQVPAGAGALNERHGAGLRPRRCTRAVDLQAVPAPPRRPRRGPRASGVFALARLLTSRLGSRRLGHHVPVLDVHALWFGVSTSFSMALPFSLVKPGALATSSPRLARPPRTRSRAPFGPEVLAGARLRRDPNHFEPPPDRVPAGSHPFEAAREPVERRFNQFRAGARSRNQS